MYELKIEGMTCVNCSSAIENGMINEFKNKGLVQNEQSDKSAASKTSNAKCEEYSVSVILLMHKMKISFYKKIAQINKIDGNRIADEIEDLGFGAKVTNTYEL